MASFCYCRDEVALIIGGYFAPDSVPTIKSVELFGCSGTQTLPLADYPMGEAFLQGGVYLEEEGRAIVCGGTK